MSINYTPVPSVRPYLLSDKFQSFIVGPVGCLAGDTKVITEAGAIAISDIDRPMRVLSWNEKTCQFQLSWCGGSFPKGRDYLYRVSTPQGEFDAAGRHLLLCADGVYRRVEDLRPGDALAPYSYNPLQTTEELCQLESLEGVQRLRKTDVGYLGDCATLNRLCGQPFLREVDNAQAFVPSHSGVQKLWTTLGRVVSYQLHSLLGASPRHIRLALYAGQKQIGGFSSLSGPPLFDAAYCGEAKSFVHGEDLYQAAQQSRQRKCFPKLKHVFSRLKASLFYPFLRSLSLTTTDRPIISIERKEVKEAYWDIQVAETENYVTVDGAIHHNSTKTTASIMKIALEAKKMAPCKDGIRRSRCAVVRNTRQMLLDSTVRDFLALFPEGVAGDYHRTELKFVLRFDDVEVEVLFRGLDTADDTRRLLSLQLSFAMVDEVREINPDIFAALTGRLGRYPNGMMVPHRPEWGLDEKGNPVQGCVDDNGKQLKKVWGATNPADADSYWEQYLTNADPEKIHVTIQPSGRSPEADWLQHLPSEYYEDLIVGKTEDWISVYIDGQWGRSLSGKPVFRGFNSDIHVSKNPLNYIKMSTHPLLIGHDFGLTPACTISQVDPQGRLLTFAELTSDGMGELRFIREKLKPLLASKFPGMPLLVIGDPAGQQRAQTDERSVFDILKQEGFRVIPAKTNSIAARINAVDSWLTRMVDGKPAMLIDPSCKTLIQALRGGYRYKIKTNGHTDETPEKNSFSHLVDGFQYTCLHADNNVSGHLLVPQAKEIQRVRYAWA